MIRDGDRHPAEGTPWRYRCPKGHAAIELFVSTFRCRSCDQSYPKDELVDLVAEAESNGGGAA